MRRDLCGVAQAFLFAFAVLLSEWFGFTLPGYDVSELLSDTQFASGFAVLSADGEEKGQFTFAPDTQPQWKIAQWNSRFCLWDDRVPRDPYTLSDGVKTVRCDPEQGSVLLDMNAAQEYAGEPAALENWPHLLLEQSPFAITQENAHFYSCDNRFLLSMDIRLADYVPTTNPDGVNAAQFLIYFYMSGKNSDDFIWFGLNLFDDRGLQDTTWSRDFADGAHNMIYTLSTRDTYGFSRRSLYQKGVSDEYTRVCVDLTPYIRDCIRRANQSGTFGKTVSPGDFRFTGMNIGFEIHGNIRCAVEFSDLSLRSFARR
ncbi:MAG: hypothetical protein ACI4I5_01305 [Acutalibacteraceae bacterium]